MNIHPCLRRVKIGDEINLIENDMQITTTEVCGHSMYGKPSIKYPIIFSQHYSGPMILHPRNYKKLLKIIKKSKIEDH